jgi:hypothetical protein
MPQRYRETDNRQVDLFDLPETVTPISEPPAAVPTSVEPEQLDDLDLLDHLAHCTINTVMPVAEEIIRRRPLGWECAVLKLWNRFLGFGVTKPMLEQRVVLDIIRRTSAGDVLRDILGRGHLATAIEPELLDAAAACGVPLHLDIVSRGLASTQPLIRETAVKLALSSGLCADELHAFLSDTSSVVRRAAAIALAEAGDVVAREPLLREMAIRPGSAGLEALSYIADENVVIRLGHIARSHPDYAEIIRDVLIGIDHPRAPIVAANLNGRVS